MDSRAPRILVCAPNWVGDAVMATPALRAVRRRWPEARIHVAGRGYLVPLLREHPGLDGFLALPRAPWSAARELRRTRFDAALLLGDSSRTALAPWLARVPVRVGYARDFLRRPLLTTALRPEFLGRRRVPVSMVERYLRLSRALGCPDAGRELELAVDAGARSAVEARLAKLEVGAEERLLVVAPGASFGASKLWPPEHFARACAALEQRHGLRPVLAPGPGEERVAEDVARGAGPGALCLSDPVTDLAELVALIGRASLVLANDTGPRHIAVALGTPVVALLGPTDPRHTDYAPGAPQRVLREPVGCSPCHLKVCPVDHRCLTRLDPERVVAAASELLA